MDKIHLGYDFSNPRLLDEALTHASLQDRSGNNERLEFLGDRVLSLVVADMLLRAFPGEKEGEIAKRHAALVQRGALAEVAVKIGLGPHMRLSAGEARAGGARKEAILADALEAVIGAIFLDGGFGPAGYFVQGHWESLLKAQAVPPEDAKTALQRWVQARGLPLPEYRIVSQKGAAHAPEFAIGVTVKGQKEVVVTAASRQAGEKEAARRMLERLEKGI